jgi:hypothetical protein
MDIVVSVIQANEGAKLAKTTIPRISLFPSFADHATIRQQNALLQEQSRAQGKKDG